MSSYGQRLHFNHLHCVGNKKHEKELDVPCKKAIRLHMKWLTEGKKCRLGDVLDPLGLLIHHDDELSEGIWFSILPIAWRKLKLEEQKIIAVHIQKLLSQNWHEVREVFKQYLF